MKAKDTLVLCAVSVAVISALPRLSLAASMPLNSGQRSGKSHGVSVRSEHRPPASHPTPKQPKFVVIRDRVEEPVSVSVNQTIVVSPAEAKKTTTNRLYISPRWVETESGVLVLEPGRWVEIEPGAEY